MENSAKQTNNEKTIERCLKQICKNAESVIDFLKGQLAFSNKCGCSDYSAEYIQEMIRKLQFITLNGSHCVSDLENHGERETADD